MTCKNCGKPIDYFPVIPAEGLQWKHADGYYGCNRTKPSANPTYAEPSEKEAA
jgi:hypothetical protein